MITLNLLPPGEKQKIASAQAQRKIFELGSMSLILISAFLALLSSIWLFLNIQQNSAAIIYQNTRNNSQNESFKKFENEISQVNQKLIYLDALQKESKHYSFVLEKLTELAPPDIKFSSFSASGNKISLTGFAAGRRALLDLKDALSQSPYFNKVDMPLQNFLKQTDINFFVSFEIK